MSVNKDFPYEIQDVEPKLGAELREYFKELPQDYVQVGPKKYVFSATYKNMYKKYYEMPLRQTDVFVVSFPRSGTTWTQELVWMVANDLDYAKSNAITLPQRYPFLEFSLFISEEMSKMLEDLNKDNEEDMKMLKEITTPAPDILAKMPSPRFVKTHIPLSLLPPQLLDVAKVVYVARDPRDAAVSYYHLTKGSNSQGPEDFKKFWNFFIKGLYTCTPYFEHLKEAWEKRNHPNMLFLFYEELSKDLSATINRVSKFFNKQYTEEEVLRLCDHLSIESFKKNKSVNNDFLSKLGLLMTGTIFIRKGKSGGWRDYFDEEMTQQAEQWIADNLRDTDLRFPHMQ